MPREFPIRVDEWAVRPGRGWEIHIDPQRAWDSSAPVADLSTDPRDPKRVGLRNLSATKWTFTAVGSAAKDVPPGRGFPVANGAKVNFGTSEGEIRS